MRTNIESRAWKSVCLAGAIIFAGSFAPTLQAVPLRIQPVKVCDDAGSNCANDSEELFLAETNKIWAQAGIEFVYLAFTSINSSELLSLDSNAEVNTLFTTAPGMHSNPSVITMWFVEFHKFAFGEVNTIGGNKIVIDEVIFADSRIDTIAHEVGHLLGLQHDDPGVEVDFLMRSGLDRTIPGAIGDITPDGSKLDKLTAAQIKTARSDPKVVPEPATVTMMLLGLVVVGLATRRRNG